MVTHFDVYPIEIYIFMGNLAFIQKRILRLYTLFNIWIIINYDNPTPEWWMFFWLDLVSYAVKSLLKTSHQSYKFYSQNFTVPLISMMHMLLCCCYADLHEPEQNPNFIAMYKVCSVIVNGSEELWDQLFR